MYWKKDATWMTGLMDGRLSSATGCMPNRCLGADDTAAGGELAYRWAGVTSCLRHGRLHLFRHQLGVEAGLILMMVGFTTHLGPAPSLISQRHPYPRCPIRAILPS